MIVQGRTTRPTRTPGFSPWPGSTTTTRSTTTPLSSWEPASETQVPCRTRHPPVTQVPGTVRHPPVQCRYSECFSTELPVHIQIYYKANPNTAYWSLANSERASNCLNHTGVFFWGGGVNPKKQTVSGSRSGSIYFRRWPSRWQLIIISTFFCLLRYGTF